MVDLVNGPLSPADLALYDARVVQEARQWKRHCRRHLDLDLDDDRAGERIAKNTKVYLSRCARWTRTYLKADRTGLDMARRHFYASRPRHLDEALLSVVGALVQKGSSRELETLAYDLALLFSHLDLDYLKDAALLRSASIMMPGKYTEEPLYERCANALSEEVVPRLAAFLDLVVQADPAGRHAYSPIDFSELLNKIVTLQRAVDAFDIVTDWPDSLPAATELKTCMERSGFRDLVETVLIASCERRLLHPGPDTDSIITQYIALIKFLRFLDPSDVFLENVGDPVRRYLRKRPDTIKCIVHRMVENNNAIFESEGGDERRRGIGVENRQREDWSDPKWQPEPKQSTREIRAKRTLDVVDILVSIFQSKEAFAKELQGIIGKRLLEVENFDVEEEIQSLEVLSLRFGESTLQACAVMIRDMVESRRTNQAALPFMSEPDKIQVKVLSRMFWPRSSPSPPILLPKSLQASLLEYEALFSRLRPGRKLRWQYGESRVSMTISMAGQQVTLSVPPLHASVLDLFTQKASYSVVELQTILSPELPIDVLLATLDFWRERQLLTPRDNGQQWALVDRETSTPSKGTAGTAESGQLATGWQGQQQLEASMMTEAPSGLNGEMRIYWLFISGALTNLGPLPLDRLQSLLTMLVPAPDRYTRTPEQLRQFLDGMVLEGSLRYDKGCYALAA